MTIAIKICGITTVDDALLAVEAGATHIGLIFVENSPRRVTPHLARQIVEALPPPVHSVGVIANQPVHAIEALLAETGVTMIQLHGEEPPQRCASLDRPLIKAITLTPHTQPEELYAYQPHVSSLLFDRPKANPPAQWLQTAIPQIQLMLPPLPFWIAGGLTPDTVGEVIDRLAVYGVDVASGVESAPGRKDPTKVRAFCQAACQAAEARSLNRGASQPCNP